MSYEIRADYTKRWLLPPSLEDWVTADHPARFIREFVDSLDMAEAGFHVRQNADGRPNYASDLLVKVWLYGYVSGIRSLRSLERACHENVAFLWLTGLQAPDHNTLWRFWRDNRKALRGIFRLVVRAAQRAKLVELVLHAVDGTKIPARASKDAVRSSKKISEELAEVERVVDEAMAQIEARAKEEESNGQGFELPEDWQKRMLRREELRELAAECEINQRETIHETEREARFMRTRREGSTLAYNAQTVVDASHGLIVAEDVITEGNDNHVLVPMIEAVEENLGAVAEQTAGDAGYYSGEQLEKAEQKQFGVLVNESQEDKPDGDPNAEFHISRFTYDEQNDRWTCPRGKELKFERVLSRGADRGSETLRSYRCTAFAECPVREQCSTNPKGRTVSLHRFHGVATRQRMKRCLPENQRLLARRKAIAEPPYAIIKWVMGFRRFTVFRFENVRVQWSMICSAYDLRKLYGSWVRGHLSFA